MAPTTSTWRMRGRCGSRHAPVSRCLRDTLAQRITEHTGRAFGKPVNPHLFRDCAATSIAIRDPEHVRIAAAILGHSRFETTERHYNLARSVDAAANYHHHLDRLRREA